MSWTKTHHLCERQGSTCMKCAQTTRPRLQPLIHSHFEKFSPHMLQLLFNFLLPPSSLNLHSARRDKAKTGMDIIKAFAATVRHLKYRLKPSLVFQRGWKWFSSVHPWWSLNFFIFFSRFYSSFYQFESRGGGEEVCLKGNPPCFVAEVTDSGWLTEWQDKADIQSVSLTTAIAATSHDPCHRICECSVVWQ